MAGLFGGSAGYGGQQAMFSPNLGILGAALKDASSAFTGQGGGDSLQQFTGLLQQRQAQQQLMAGLASADPAVRQQAYTQAAMLGIDTKPMQAAQAAQATPDLLSAMRPTSQELVIPGGSVPFKGVTGSPLTATLPATDTGQMVSAPGKSLAEAIGGLAAKYPELATQYAPDIIKQQDEANKPFDLSPGTTRYVNNEPVVTAPMKNNPNQPFNVDGTPNAAFQSWEIRKSRETAKARADFRAPPKPSANGAIALPHPGSMY